MARKQRKAPGPLREGFSFALIVLVLALAAAGISFRVGRDWLGKRLPDVQTASGAPRIVAQSRTDPEEATRSAAEAKAPEKAVVSVEDRDPTPSERREAEQGHPTSEQSGPDTSQDGDTQPKADKKAAKDKTDQSATSSDSAKSSSDAASDSGDSTKGKYVVTAGSYSDPARAAKVMAKLKAKGYSPYIEEIHRDGKTFRRVNVAQVSGRDKAQDLADEVSGEGLDASVKPAH